MQNESRQEKIPHREPLTLRQFIEEPDTGGHAEWRWISRKR